MSFRIAYRTFRSKRVGRYPGQYRTRRRRGVGSYLGDAAASGGAGGEGEEEGEEAEEEGAVAGARGEVRAGGLSAQISAAQAVRAEISIEQAVRTEIRTGYRIAKAWASSSRRIAELRIGYGTVGMLVATATSTGKILDLSNRYCTGGVLDLSNSDSVSSSSGSQGLYQADHPCYVVGNLVAAYASSVPHIAQRS
eukprot:2107043-Rhodomonas_salina.5